MDKILALYLLLPFIFIILYQPILNDIEEARGELSQMAIERGTELAAVKGYYTPEIIEEMYLIMESVGYECSQVELTVTDTPQLRGSYVTGTIKVPNEYRFLLIIICLKIIQLRITT
jgi:hypothetical protein